MKSKFWKTGILVLVLCVNVGLLIAVAVLLSKATKPKKYASEIVQTEDDDFGIITCYPVEYGVLYGKEYEDSCIHIEDDAYETYVLDELNGLDLFDEVETGMVLGKSDSADVLSLSKGRIVSLALSDGKYTMMTVNYDRVQVCMNMSYDTFYSTNVKTEDFYFDYGDKQYGLSFSRIVFDSVTDETISVIFDIKDNDLFLNNGFSLMAYRVTDTYSGVYYLENCEFLQSYTMAYVHAIDESGSYSSFSIYCTEIIDDTYYVIESGYLKAGMKLYA